jgi:hypothetical protein
MAAIAAGLRGINVPATEHFAEANVWWLPVVIHHERLVHLLIKKLGTNSILLHIHSWRQLPLASQVFRVRPVSDMNTLKVQRRGTDLRYVLVSIIQTSSLLPKSTQLCVT